MSEAIKSEYQVQIIIHSSYEQKQHLFHLEYGYMFSAKLHVGFNLL